MNQATPSADVRRAQRLSAYLREDPTNAALLADACDAALAAGLHAQTAAHIAAAGALGLDAPDWAFRHARLCIAERKLEQAAALLQRVQTEREDAAVIHDLAYVRLLQDQPRECRHLLAPWLGAGAPAGSETPLQTLEALQVLWLRAIHRLNLLQEGWDWVVDSLADGRLQPAAKGVASLLALDLDRFADARALADAALAVSPRQVEAMVARASIALAERDIARAVHLLERALACNPDDGRTWSALGLCSLQARELPLAQTRLERALRTVPAHIGTWHALGWTRLLQQDVAEALTAFRAALELDRNFAESHGAVGLALMLAGEKAQAGEHLERARRLDPANVTGRYARALLAGEAGDLARLLALSDRLLDRPGFASGKLSDAVRAATARPRK